MSTYMRIVPPAQQRVVEEDRTRVFVAHRHRRDVGEEGGGGGRGEESRGSNAQVHVHILAPAVQVTDGREGARECSAEADSSSREAGRSWEGGERMQNKTDTSK